MPWLFRLVLAIACRIAPAGERERCRPHWQSDLEALNTLVERGELAPGGRTELVRFCVEACATALRLRFGKDALRRWSRSPEFIALSGAVLLLVLGALSRGFAKTRFLIYVARHWQPAPPKGLSYDPRGDLLAAYGFPIVLAATTGLILIAIGCRMLHRGTWRYWAFFTAKIVLLMLVGSVVWIEGGAALRSVLPRGQFRVLCGGALLAMGFVGGAGWCALWSLADQRRRCPVCLRPLEMPVTMGSWSSVFEPATTEFLCSDGHGALSLLEVEPAADRWVALDDSWRGLFRSKSDEKDPILR
jgi:hypothetical protein